jgi:hypothetical protein
MLTNPLATSIPLLRIICNCTSYDWLKKRLEHDPDRQTTRTFVEFINGDVDTETGQLSGRATFVQIAVMPILLAIGGTVIATIYLIVAR